MIDDQAPNIVSLVDEVLGDYRDNPVDIWNIEDTDGEYRYLQAHKKQYIRTIIDIVEYFRAANPNSIRILEIGSYLGLVSIVLSKIGFRVTALDIKEYMSSEKLLSKFKRHKIEYIASNLREYQLPFPDDRFDIVISCEVFEHLNFNPLPIIKEINRVTKINGFLYVSVPNIANLHNRLKLFNGESIHNPISEFFDQLQLKKNKIVGLHWREYTAAEMNEMLNLMDFDVIQQKFDPVYYITRKNHIMQALIHFIKRVFYIRCIRRFIIRCLFDVNHDPTLKDFQVTYAVKKRKATHTFYLSDAVNPGTSCDR